MTYSTLICLCRNCYLLFNAEFSPPNLDLGAGGLDSAQKYPCPSCGTEISPELEQSWMKGLVAAHVEVRTNGYSSEARAKMSVGSQQQTNHNGPNDEATKLRTSANALKHGAFAMKHLLPIARAGEYGACTSCPFAPVAKNPAGNDRCQQERFLYCQMPLAAMAAVANAHVNKDPSHLRELMGGIQGLALHNLHQGLVTILQEGPVLESEIVRPDKDGNPVNCGTRKDSHPALKAIEVFSNMLHGVDLPAWKLTPKSTDEAETANDLQTLMQGLMTKFMPPPNDQPRQLEQPA